MAIFTIEASRFTTSAGPPSFERLPSDESAARILVIARSEATKQSSSLCALDCFAEPVIGARSRDPLAPTRLARNDVFD